MSTAQLSDQQVLELGAKLRSARETQGKDLSESAFRIALSPSQLRALESGDRRPFYSTHYFLQAVDRYAEFLGVPPAELEDYRPKVPPLAADPQEKTEQPAPVIDEHAPLEARSYASPRNINAPGAVVASPARAATAEGKRPSLAVMAIGTAVIVLSIFITLKDSPQPPTTPVTASVEPQQAAAAPAPTAEPTSASAAETTKPAPANAEPAATPKPAAAGSDKDARIASSVNAWVQIVSKSGEKSNLRIAAGESIEFVASETAAVVIGKPETATLTVRGKAVDLRPHASSKDGSSRALVVIGDIRH